MVELDERERESEMGKLDRSESNLRRLDNRSEVVFTIFNSVDSRGFKSNNTS